MTKHKIDDLFKQKLDNHQVEPSSAAWAKLESEFNKKQKKGIIFWVGIAASIVLLVTFGWLTLNDDTTIEEPTIASTDPVSPEVIINTFKSVDNTTQPIKVEEREKKSEKKSVKQSPKPEPNVKRTPVKKQPKASVLLIQQESNLAQNSAEKTIKEGTESETNTPDLSDISLENTELVANNTTNEEKGSVKLIYTLKPVISPQETVEGEPKPDKIKSNSLKKVFAFAKEIKENPAGIGGLREAKNGFLSLNKKKNDSK